MSCVDRLETAHLAEIEALEAQRTELEEAWTKKYNESIDAITTERNELVAAAEATAKEADKQYKYLLSR